MFNASTGELSATDFNSTSDLRLKTDLQKIERALEKIKTLTGYTFTMRDSGMRGAGLIAQEVLEILPEAVNTDIEEKLSLSYGNVLGLIVEAIKELDAKIENLINNK